MTTEPLPKQSETAHPATRKNTNVSKISIIGSGGIATAIGILAAKAGHTVEVLIRDIAKARALAYLVGSGAAAGTFGAIPAGDVVILAVPYAVVLGVVKQFGEALAGKLLVDITNPINSDLTGFVTPAGSSGAREIAKVASANAIIVKAFNTLNANVLAAGTVVGRPLDTFLAGDDAPAKARVSAFIRTLGLRPLDAGPLAMARTLEHACMLMLGLKIHTIKHLNFSLDVSLPG